MSNSELSLTAHYLSNLKTRADLVDSLKLMTALLVDFWASFRGRAVSLCGKYIAPTTTSEYIRKRHYPPDVPSADEASKFILKKLFNELEGHVNQARKVFQAKNKELNIVSRTSTSPSDWQLYLGLNMLLFPNPSHPQCIVLDNHEAAVKAKYLAKRDRSESRTKALKRHAAAVKRLETLLGKTSNPDRQGEYFPSSCSAREQKLDPTR